MSFCKHPCKLEIRTLRFRAMHHLQRAQSAKFPAPLATSAKREVPRATCNERGARSSPRDLQRARSAKFPAQLATSAKREVPRATCNERGARSSPRNLQRAQSAKFPAQLATSAKREVPRATCNEREARSSPRDLQRARSAKFPAQKSQRVSDKRKTLQRFSAPDFNDGDISDGAFYHTSFMNALRHP